MIKDEIALAIKSAVKDLTGLDVEPKIEYPLDEKHGDYSANIALTIFAKSKIKSQSAKQPLKSQNFQSPMELAEKIIGNLKFEIGNLKFIDHAEVASPGFINFFVSKEYFQNQVKEIIEKGSEFGSSIKGKGKKVLVEFVSANPTGPLHMGNLRGGPMGDVIAGVLSKAGYSVSREFYVNNVGHQVDLMYASLASQIKIKETNLLEVAKKYNASWSIYPADSYKGKAYEVLANKVASLLDQSSEEKMINDFEERVMEVVVDSMKKDLRDLGIEFDKWVFESDIKEKYTTDAIGNLKAVQKKDGAIWFAPKDDFLKDRESVLIKSDGSYTYFANDIAYHKNKFERGFKLLIDVWGANHHGHIPRMKAAISAMGFDPEDLKIVLYQWVSLIKEGKKISMSKRKGEFITAREIIDEIGKDALRYFLLSASASSPVDLNLDLAKKRANENPVFYVQYAHARISSIFRKNEAGDNLSTQNINLLNAPEEIAVIRHLIKYPQLINDVSDSYEVHRLTTYLFELADLFHGFYEANQVLTEDKNLTSARLSLLKALQIVLRDCLRILGIDAPERM